MSDEIKWCSEHGTKPHEKCDVCKAVAESSFAAPHGPAWEADYKCNLCGQITRRTTLRWRTWLPSYCDKSGKLGRLYRISTATPNDGTQPPRKEKL